MLHKLHAIFMGLIVLAGSTLCPGSVEADRGGIPRWAADASFGLYSDYMFRGRQFYDGVSAQPSLSASYFFGNFGSLSGNIWAHLPLEGDKSSGNWQEVDYTLVHDMSFEPLTYSFGHTWYTYGKNDLALSDTGELFVSVTADMTAQPSFTFYHDYREIDAQHYELSFSEQFEMPSLGKKTSVTPYLAFGFSSRSDPNYEDGGLAHVSWGIAGNTFMKNMRLSPSLNLTHGIDSGTADEFWFGITIGWMF